MGTLNSQTRYGPPATSCSAIGASTFVPGGTGRQASVRHWSGAVTSGLSQYMPSIGPRPINPRGPAQPINSPNAASQTAFP